GNLRVAKSFGTRQLLWVHTGPIFQGPNMNLKDGVDQMRRSVRSATGTPTRLSAAFLIALGALGAAALVVRSKTRKAERTHPPIGQFMEIDGVRLHYMERGQGQPLVLFHGNTVM